MKLGEMLKQARERLKVTVQTTPKPADIARGVGVTRQAVVDWERSKSLPDGLRLRKVAECYRLDYDKVLRVWESEAVAPQAVDVAAYEAIGELLLRPDGVTMRDAVAVVGEKARYILPRLVARGQAKRVSAGRRVAYKAVTA